MNETFDPGGQLLVLALVFFYWQLLRIWQQPPPPDDQGGEQPPSGSTDGLAPVALRTATAPAAAARRGQPAPAAAAGNAADTRAADIAFDETAFLAGAAAAYEAIVNAYAREDIGVLERLLDAQACSDFKDAIAARRERGETFTFTFIGHRSIDIVQAQSSADMAEITVRFTTEAVAATHGGDGSLIDGTPDQVVEITDTWIFARRVASRDPDWKLVATRADADPE